MKFSTAIIKLFRHGVVLIGVIGCSLSSISAQTNGAVAVRPVSNTAINSSATINNKSSAATLNENKVKMVDKKKRKPSRVTTIKKTLNTVQNKKN